VRAAVWLALTGLTGGCGSAPPTDGSEALAAAAPPSADASQADPAARPTRATLEIEGMVCEGCAQAVEESLASIDGVQSVHADHQEGVAVAIFDPARTNVDELLRALAGIDRAPARPFRVVRLSTR
jgi:copper chaperone CopZ